MNLPIGEFLDDESDVHALFHGMWSALPSPKPEPDTFEGNLKLHYWRLGYAIVWGAKTGGLISLGYVLAG